jgi:hypothetical protein
MPEPRSPSDHRAEVRARARLTCEYCRGQERFGMQSFSLEHIQPVQTGGSDDLANLALACQGCNNHKYTRTQGRDPATGETVDLFHPRQDLWQDHFIWSNDFTRIVGLTPAGRATVEILKLNRPGLVNLRRVLYAAGEHPPPEPIER